MKIKNVRQLVQSVVVLTSLVLLLVLVSFQLKSLPPRIDISTFNSGDVVVRNLDVFIPPETDFGVGGLARKILRPGIRSTHVNYGFELPHQFRVEWKTPNGQMHKQLVTLPGREQITEPTHLIIAVDNDRVTLKIESIRVPND